MPVAVMSTPLDSPVAQALVGELDDLLNSLYPPEGDFLHLDQRDLSDGCGLFLVATEDGEPLGCGAVRRISADAAEVKRMYVRPDARRRGVGRLILAELESWGRHNGFASLRLETGPLQDESIRLYERAGFVRIPCYGQYVGSGHSLCYEKALHSGG